MIQPTCQVNHVQDEARLVFPTKDSYEKYRQSYRARAIPILMKHRKAHQASIERSRTRFIGN
jgi:hypothetical protein